MMAWLNISPPNTDGLIKPTMMLGQSHHIENNELKLLFDVIIYENHVNKQGLRLAIKSKKNPDGRFQTCCLLKDNSVQQLQKMW